jgi:hypothetical protein
MYINKYKEMRKIILMAALFVALGATTVNAQYTNRDQTERRTTEPGVYQDDRGKYQWQIVEHRVWIPERRTAGIFGIGSRIIPGHYEMRTDRVKLYRNQDRNGQYSNQRRGWEGKHPHGMPPGQRKKYENRRGSDDRYENRDDDDHESRGKNKHHNDRDDD